MKYLMIFCSVALVLSACKHDIPVPEDPELTNDPPPPVEEECDPGIVYFQQEILPLFQSSCAIPGCHSAADAQNDVILNSYASIMASGEIEPGDLSDGDIYEVITESDPDDVMPPPPNEPLSADQIDRIATWILQGAQNNSCESLLCDTLNVAFSTHISLLVENKCEGCHNASDPSAGLSLTAYSEIATIANNGSMMSSLLGEGSFTSMPYNADPLSDCEIRQVEIWIENGAPND